MGTFDQDIHAYWTRCQGEFKQEELLQSLVTLSKIGAEFGGAFTVWCAAAGAGAFVTSLFPGLESQVRVALMQLARIYPTLDTEERQAAIRLATFARHIGQVHLVK